MTTSIILTMIEPMCELFYKNQKAAEIKTANDNTFRCYGFSTSFAVNFGFELPHSLDVNNLQIQPGVIFSQNQFLAYPNVNSTTSVSLTNNIVLQDLPETGIGTVNYQEKTLPIEVLLHQGINSVIGIASAIMSVPYDSSLNITDSIVRDFESNLVFDSAFSALVFVNFENAEITGIGTNWVLAPTSLYSTDIRSYRYNNGYGQFYSYSASRSFASVSVGVSTLNPQLENVTYMNVYNWVNLLDWQPNFSDWYSINKNLVPVFTQRFLFEYFNIS